MRPIIQMIFTVQEVRQNDSGLTYVRGYVMNGRDNNNNPNFATVNVFIPESASYYADLALTLEKGQRVFVAGTVSINSFVSTNTQELRSVYKINFPSAFVPLDVPSGAQEPSAEEAAVESAEGAVVESAEEVVTAPQQPQRRVEMSGVARANTQVPRQKVQPAQAAQPASQPAATATAARRPTTFTIPRPQRVGEAVQNNGAEAAEDEIGYDPFAE